MLHPHVFFIKLMYLGEIDVQEYFGDLSQKLFKLLSGEEELLLNYSGEDSDFTRFNHNRVRQCGYVRQQYLRLNLIRKHKQCAADMSLSGDLESDFIYAKKELDALRTQLPFLPDDPYLHYSTQVHNTLHVGDYELPAAEQIVEQITQCATDLDLVGVLASGQMARGFANSMGQFNWHSHCNFNFDWSIYLRGDKAVKQNYAGSQWQLKQFEQKISQARSTLQVLDRPEKTIQPGTYRVFLTANALYELLQLLGWGGFGLKSHRTAQTPLIKMVEDNICLSDQLTLVENHAQGLSPRFTSQGFTKPEKVVLIEDGKYKDCLSGARSAKEYGEAVNSGSESPQAMYMAGGSLPTNRALEALNTGVWISNLWYCNYSDRNNARITGMIRFACLWVEQGKVVAPLKVMRFDESIFNILGPKLEGLTKERDLIIDSSTYEQRSDACARLPGALVRDFTFTL